MMMRHLDEATRNALVDGDLADDARTRAVAHIETCDACAAEVAALRTLVRDVGTLAGIAPGRDLLTGIHAAIDAAGVVPLHGRASANNASAAAGATGVHRGAFTPADEPAATPWPSRRARWALAAAAVSLIAVSSAVTALLLRPEPAAFVVVDAVGVVPAGVVDRAEARFVSATDELERLLRAQRSQLSPETIRVLEESLAVIDVALEEARQALEADPGNAVLSEILMATYEKKLDLLRRAAASVVT